MLGLRSVFGKIGAICVACLLAGMMCMIFPMCVQSAEENSIVQTASAKVYSGMSDSSDIIANLIVGNVFEVVGTEYDSAGSVWYIVKTDFGVEGYAKAVELDRLILGAQAMVPPVAAEYPGDNTAEASEPEGDQSQEAGDSDSGQETEGEDIVEKSVGEAAVTDNNVVEVPEPEDGDNIEESAGEDGPVDDSADEEQETEEKTMPESSTEQVSESEIIDGAGFGKAVDHQAPDDEETGNEGFTVIEKKDEAEIHRHGRMDAMLMMIMAGGILCIMAIAALARRMWTCIRTKT